MALFQIKHRFSGAVLFELECGSLKLCVEAAIKARANLADANLAGANLADANLAGANLAGANLADANLAGANLAGANLAGANLADANLAGANLADANLAGANLIDAGQDRRGYRFLACRNKDNTVVYHAGCHTWTSIEDALAHYGDGYRSNGDRAECIARLTLLRDEAARRWPAETTQEAA